MIHTLVMTNDQVLEKNIPLQQIMNTDLQWFWVDFDTPTDKEISLLKTVFDFHPLAIEDCMHVLQRPKLDHYDKYDFFVLHTLRQNSLQLSEVDLFAGENFIVSFHLAPSPEIDIVRERIFKRDKISEKLKPINIFYFIMDKIVDEYFPIIYQIEDGLNEMESKEEKHRLIEEVYVFRSQLLKLRRTIFPMRELLYRMLNSERLIIPKDERIYFIDIHDHLIKLSEMIESNREMTADIRDNYLSLNSNRMNVIMKTLTVMSSIFIPLTFIASIYGMNFTYMPELSWRWGYFFVLGVMAGVGSAMFVWLWRKGWFK
ncbi:magnesium/cobalt transporter CorA [Bacillaceae bacterium Marseille-Q3522]|nr:magnesium/cobalt transporter CorA [Bacillaceae bacterium Marseille-Q3522]